MQPQEDSTMQQAVAGLLKNPEQMAPPEENPGEAGGDKTAPPGAIMIDAAQFPSLSDKKPGDVVYLVVKIDRIEGRTMQVSPAKEDGSQQPEEGKEVPPADGGQKATQGVTY